MKHLFAGFVAALALVTVGSGVASADPINRNSRYFSANCDGEVLAFVTTSGGAAQVIGDSRVAVLQGMTMDGEWVLPINKGQSKASLVECAYTQLFDGHQFVIYVILKQG
jgi:hypothetical protein